MCRIHQYRDVEALPLEYGGQGAIFVPTRQRCSLCGRERVSHTIRWEGTSEPRVQAPTVPYASAAEPVQLPLFAI